MRCVTLTLVLCIHACTCGDDADGSPDASIDAEPSDAAADRDGDDGGLSSLPECQPLYHDWFETRALVDCPNIERSDTEYELAVVEVTEQHLRLEAEADAEPDDEPTVVINWPITDARIVLPLLGERVLAMGGTCDSGHEAGYVRITTLDHDVLWEGTDPGCPSNPGGYPWGPYLSLRPATPDGWCKDLLEPRDHYPEGECCCVSRKDMEVVLSLPGEDPVVLPAGDQREVVIDGASFAVFSQGAYALMDGPCTFDVATAGVGSAYLFRIQP